MNIYVHNELFLSNKYTKWYYNIIENAISQERKKLKRTTPNFIYYEAHHVLPKSIFPEFNKEKWNIVLLTAREHFICHALLCKMVQSGSKECFKMNSAIIMMTCSKRKNIPKYNSIIFKNIRENFVKELILSYNVEKRKHYSNKLSGKGNGMYGKKHTEKTKQLIGKQNKGKKRTPEQIKSMKVLNSGQGNGMYGKIGENNPNKNKTHWNNGITTTTSIECPGDGWIKGMLEKDKEQIRSYVNKNRGGFKGKHNPMYGKIGENNPNFGKVHWTNGIENKFQKESPGENWRRGFIIQKKKLKDQNHSQPNN